ncbi:cardiolipin synthase [Galactobacter valiniphilus]|uniref:Cardiolipin synthase n=1 Tax=Galactobacter valiniphilus TaxID=2676122 RepID=A0A399JCB5_9MICC|nr:cardiolipin synthase [Galactobacter valiniphilus]RII42720.1 cardiolipin synthase [Galactobacter valiniphilus]
MQLLWFGNGTWWGLLIGLGLVLLHLAVIIRALTRPHRAAASRVAWVAVLLFLPLLGVIVYLFLGETSIGRGREERMAAAEASLPLPRPPHAPALSASAEAIMKLATSVNGFEPTEGNSIALQADSNAAVDSLVADIDAARSTIHISFYIWLADNNGTKVADAITRAAARGVTCRIMVDALGSRAFLSSKQWAGMSAAGAHCVAGLRDVPRWGRLAVGRPDLRNHRKIVVIDDAIAYMGSQNCADPEFRVKPKFAPWVDVFFRCTGPLVAQHQWLFLTTWLTEQPDDAAARVPARAPQASSGRSGSAAEGERGVAAVAFGTGPTVRAGAMSEAFVAVIGSAHDELVVTTPYFVPDEPLLAALCAAPRRGVDTTLIVPARNDSWLVAQSAESAYERLLEAGVRLYEYPLGLLHSKTITVDGQLALVGSANMDRRSLELNYENNVVIASAAVTADVRARQQSYLDASSPVALEAVSAWSFPRRLVHNVVAMLAPLL